MFTTTTLKSTSAPIRRRSRLGIALAAVGIVVAGCGTVGSTAGDKPGANLPGYSHDHDSRIVDTTPHGYSYYHDSRIVETTPTGYSYTHDSRIVETTPSGYSRTHDSRING